MTLMAIDYTSHPADLNAVTPGFAGTAKIADLRAAIPQQCFRPSLMRSLGYLFRDVLMVALTGWLALRYIPAIQNQILGSFAWIIYGFVQGLFFTGLWVLGHECGHGSFSMISWVNDSLGFVLHSALLTPYFSWQSSHRRHHIYANHMELDHNYVPQRYSAYLKSLGETVHDVGEDAPVYILGRIVMQQLLGFPCYLLANVSASPKSLASMKPSGYWFGNSHFALFGSLFRPEEASAILASDAGVLATMLALTYFGQSLGSSTIMLLYLQPYLWLNHWIVAITYLHHTHPSVPRFDPQAWTFIKGATATIDREFGFIGKHCFHNIIEFHVIHHLFSRIPHYHAEEATRAIQPLLGNLYREDKRRPFFFGLWEAFTKCQFVAPDSVDNAKERSLWFQAGRMPPPEYCMNHRGWIPKH